MLSATPCQDDDRHSPKSPTGVIIPRILFPAESIDLYRWAVIACDQHTARPAYWQETARIVGDATSTLNLILPEYYLEHPDAVPIEQRIETINTSMRQYLDLGLLRALDPGCILIDRMTPEHASRIGLVLAIDLDCYDYTPGNKNLIRATEGTVIERIPPRVAIRRDAPLELPHVQVLIDDPQRQVIEPLFETVQANGLDPLYETALMQGGGSVSGWFIPADSLQLSRSLEALHTLDSFVKYGLMMAVGDGNHSLATAKAHWETNRNHLPEDHPARYALVEVINLHDNGLSFEPIHRAIAGISLDQFVQEALCWFMDQAICFAPPDDAQSHVNASVVIPVLSQEQNLDMMIASPDVSLPVGLLQPFLDHLVLKTPARIDYIHGSSEVRRLADAGQIGLLLPAMDKHNLFPSIARDGVLPRKTFSMGEAHEKRYYMECRSIR
ncbi:MAG: DUF1015 domain-containing protein [Bacillota bacterium]|nr:DUF1015 domain-containing protein [Bacillota bacterium]